MASNVNTLRYRSAVDAEHRVGSVRLPLRHQRPCRTAIQTPCANTPPAAAPLQEHATPPTLADMMADTSSYKAFMQQLQAKPSVSQDWISFISRPWVQGPLEAFLGNREGAAMMEADHQLGAAMHSVVDTLDRAVSQDDVRWLVHVLERVTSSPSVYTLLGALEQVMDNERIAFLEELEGRLLTRPRLARLGAVCIMVLTPDVLLQRFEGRASPEQQVAGPVLANWRGPEGDDGRDKLRVGAAARLVAGARQFWTDERIDRFLDLAELSLCDVNLELLEQVLQQLEACVPLEELQQLLVQAADAFDGAFEPGLLAEAAAALVGELSPGRVAQLGAVCDDLLQPEQVQRRLDLVHQVMSEERTARIPLLLPQLAPLFTPAAMQRAASLLEVLLEAHSSAELHVVDKGLDRLHRYTSTVWSMIDAPGLALALDAAYELLAPQQRLRRLLLALLGPDAAAPQAAAVPAAAGQPPLHAKVLAACDTLMQPQVLRGLGALLRELLQPARVQMLAGLLDDTLLLQEQAPANSGSGSSSSLTWATTLLMLVPQGILVASITAAGHLASSRGGLAVLVQLMDGCMHLARWKAGSQAAAAGARTSSDSTSQGAAASDAALVTNMTM